MRRHDPVFANALQSDANNLAIPLQYFVACYCPSERQKRIPTWGENQPEEQWRSFEVSEVLGRDKASLDIFWLKDKSMNDLENLPEPDILAAEIIDEMKAGLLNFRSVLLALEKP